MSVVEDGLAKARAFLASIPRAAEVAMSRALNAALIEGRNAAVKAITDRYAVRAADIREKITIAQATPDRLSIDVTARSGPLALGYFPHSPVAPGTGGRGKAPLTAEVLRGAERVVAGAFIAMINGKPRIMQRTGGITRTGKTAIKSVYTVPMGSMLGVDSVRAYVEARAVEVVEKRLDREIDRALGAA